MAVYSTDFGSFPTGSPPPNWTEIVGSWDVITDAGAPSGQSMQTIVSVGRAGGSGVLPSAFHGIELDLFSSDPNVDVIVRFDAPLRSNFGVTFRDREYFLFTDNSLGLNNVFLWRNSTPLANWSVGGIVDDGNLRVQIEDNIIRFKHWRGSLASEPASWTQEYTDVTNPGPYGGGKTGLIAGNANTNPNTEIEVWEFYLDLLDLTPPTDLDDVDAGTLKKIWSTTTTTWGNVPTNYTVVRDAAHYNAIKGKINACCVATGYPGTGLVLDTIPKAHEQEVEGLVMWDSFESGFSWSWYWKIEWCPAGIIACGDGIMEQDPSQVSGVFFSLQPTFPWPFGDCASIRAQSDFYAIVEVVSKGAIRDLRRLHISPINSFDVTKRLCTIPWVGMKLRILRDPSDPTLNTLDIKAAYDLGGTIPDTDTNGWDIEFTSVADVPCGHGGYGARLIQSAWGGGPGAAYYKSGKVSNLGEICVPDQITPETLLPPTIDAFVNCERVVLIGGAYIGPGTHIESRWVVRKATSGMLIPGLTAQANYGTYKANYVPTAGEIVIDTGFQSEFLTLYTILVSSGDLDPFTDYTATVEYRDDLGNTTPASTPVDFRTRINPDTPRLWIVSFTGNLITVESSEFSSQDETATHLATVWDLDTDPAFGANDVPVRDPLISYQTSNPAELTTYTFDITGLGIESGDLIYIRVSYLDNYGCSSTKTICVQWWPDCPPDLIETYTKPVDASDSWTKPAEPVDTSSDCKDCP